MSYALLILAILLLIYGPQLWVRLVMQRYGRNLDDIPGTGGELALHLIRRFELEGVKVEQGVPGGDHYDPQNKVVRLSPDNYDGRSLTAVAVAAHEVGHAIQFNRQEPISQLRQRYLTKAQLVQRFGMAVMMLVPVVTAIFHVPHVVLFTLVVGIITMFASVLLYVAVLPEEWDASFNKALPILLEGQYIKDRQVNAVRQVLRAAALTYVAAALADILRLWRWLAILRGLR